MVCAGSLVGVAIHAHGGDSQARVYLVDGAPNKDQQENYGSDSFGSPKAWFGFVVISGFDWFGFISPGTA